MGENMGVFQTLNHDTVNGWKGAYDFLCDKYIMKENPPSWRRNVA